MGFPWEKDERKLSQQAKKEFFPPGEEFSEDKNGVRRTSLLPPWDEVSLQILRYITCEGRFSIIYGYQFRLLTELRHHSDLPVEKRLSIPYFLLQSLMECVTKLKEGIPDQVAHHGLIKLLVEDALHSYKVPLAWEAFRNLTKAGDIKMMTEERSSSSSEDMEPVAKKRKETSQKTTPSVQKKEKKQKQIKKDAEERIETPIYTARERRLQVRAEQAEKPHVSTSTSLVPATKSQAKVHTEKQAKVATPVATGKQKRVSTGSPKTIKERVSTGSPKVTKTGASTGSPAKVKTKKERADILEREAAVVLAALSTPPKPREKRKRDTPLYFKARRSVRIKTGKPQPPSKSPIFIEDAPTSPPERSPSKSPVTYERGSPKKNTWQEKLDLLTEKTRLQEAENVLQETMARLQETERREGEGPSSPPMEAKVEQPIEVEEEQIQEPSPQPSLGSYYMFLNAGKIIPQKFTMPLFFALEEERIRTHTWMKIAKSKGVADIGPLQE